MKAGKLNPVHTGQVTTIERTGKGLKGQQVLATLGLLAGVVMLIIAFSDPVRDKRSDAAPAMVWGWVVLVGSILWLLYVRVAMWWRHG